jgi:HEAT repeat protein
MGVAAKNAVPDLRKALTDKDAMVRSAAAIALKNIESDATIDPGTAGK